MGSRALNMCNTVSEAGGGTGKAEIMECRCYVCTEQTEALYTGNCTLICIVQTQREEEGGRRRRKERRIKLGRRRGQKEKYFSK